MITDTQAPVAPEKGRGFPGQRLNSNGFTLVELMIIIAIVALLAALLLPGMSQAKARAQSAVCRANLKQLGAGWRAYCDDHTDSLVANKWRVVTWNDDCPEGAQSSADSWVLGDATFDVHTWNIQNGSLYRFVGSTGPYHCPADRSTVSDRRPALLRTRSYSMSYYMNGSPWKPERKTKLSEILYPDQTFVFLDEHENSINDGVFFVHVPGDLGERTAGVHWMDLPANRHSQGCNLAFADGRVDHLKWLWPKNRDPDMPVANEADLHDLRSLQKFIPQPWQPELASHP